jgi:truncated hemoglobin YjbI
MWMWRHVSLQEVFYGKMLSDERVSFFFEGVDMKKQKGHQVHISPVAIPNV